MKAWLVAALDFPPRRGGIQTYLFELLQELSPARVVVPDQVAAAAWDVAAPFPVQRVACVPGVFGVVAVAARTLMIAWRERPSGVLLGHPKLAPLALIFESLGIPCVVCTYGMELTQGRFKTLERLGLRHASRVLTISDYTRACLVRLGLDETRIRMVRPGVRDLSPSSRDVSPPSSPDVGDSSRVVLTVGRVSRDEGYKGHDVMLKALDHVVPQVPDVRWVVVGSGSGLKDLERLVDGSAHRNRVLLVGETDDATRDRWYRTAQVVAMPSRVIRDRAGERFEGFGIVYLEAGLFERPVVAGRAGGAVDAVADGVTGLLVDPEDPRAVGEALVTLLTNPDRARTMGCAGRRRALDEFAWATARGHLAAALAEVSA